MRGTPVANVRDAIPAQREATRRDAVPRNGPQSAGPVRERIIDSVDGESCVGDLSQGQPPVVFRRLT